uniref:Alpha/beta hydrolase fold-3 domain-containing protein n=2 Tax=Tetranychus urticae TaxID=32264 RepID=T1JYX5_TETUR
MSQERSKLIIMDMASVCIEPSFSENLEKIRKSMLIYNSHAPVYDLNDKLASNGYRSLIKLMENFSRLAYHDMKSRSFAGVSPHIVKMSEVFAKMFDHLDERKVLDSQSLMWPPDADFIQIAFSFEPIMHAFYARNHNFWLCPSLRSILGNYISLVAYKSLKFFDMYRLFSRASTSRLFADYASNVSIDFVRMVWGMSEAAFYKKLYPMLLYGTRPSRKKTLYAPRQEFARIVGHDGLIEFNESHRNIWNVNKPVRFRFLQDTKSSLSTSTLVFHCHGAGFVAQSPESHEIYLRDWAIKLRGVPLVSVDYRLAPENKFPSGLQDCLDLYLWITSGLDEVKDLIGFHPKRIILCGDSAGGGLCISLTLVLNELKNLMKIQMPSSLIPFYPVCSLQTCASPSRLFTFFDTFLPLGVLLSILDAYFVDTNSNVPTKRQDNNSQTLKQKQIFGKNLEIGPHSMTPPWYKESDFKERLAQINKIAADPFASPLNYQNFSTLNDVSLNIIVGEFDPLLDEAIEFSRKWKGPISLDVVPNISHGFLYFANISVHSKKATNLCFQRVMEAVHFPQAKI